MKRFLTIVGLAALVLLLLLCGEKLAFAATALPTQPADMWTCMRQGDGSWKLANVAASSIQQVD